jgi:hypothetical protein
MCGVGESGEKVENVGEMVKLGGKSGEMGGIGWTWVEMGGK